MFLKKERSFQIKIAYLVSRIFEPFAWLALVGLAVVFSPELNGYNRVWWTAGLIFFLTGLPLLTLFLALKKSKVKDIDFTKRAERTPYILVILFYWALGLIFTWGVGGPKVIIKILLLAFIIGLVVLIVNFYYKISNHALGFTVASLLLNEFYDWRYFWLLFFIPLIFWSRYAQKKHTLGQLFLGTVLGVAGWLLWRWIN